MKLFGRTGNILAVSICLPVMLAVYADASACTGTGLVKYEKVSYVNVKVDASSDSVNDFKGLKGISIDNGNKLLTVDDEGHLIEVNKVGNINVLDEEYKYSLNEKSDGTVTITDSSGGMVTVADDGQISVQKAVEEDTGKSKKDQDDKSWITNPFLDFGIGLAIIASGVIVGNVKKKNKKS